jgi:hypothetical protein
MSFIDKVQNIPFKPAIVSEIPMITTSDTHVQDLNKGGDVEKEEVLNLLYQIYNFSIKFYS